MVAINTRWLADTGERAARSFAQGTLTVFTGNALSIWGLDWKAALGVGLGGAAYSLLTSIASTPFGESGTASLLPAPKPVPQSAVPAPWTGTHPTRDV